MTAVNAIPDDDGWLGGPVDELPLYVTGIVASHVRGRSADGRVTPGAGRWAGGSRAAAPALACWRTATDPSGAAGAPATLVITRIIGVAPELAETTVGAWWRALGPRAVIKVTNRYVMLGAPVHDGYPTVICHLPATIRRSWRSRAVHLELGLAAWSSSDTEIDLRPRRRVGPLSRYFRVGHAIVDRVADDLHDLAGRPAPRRGARAM